MAARCPTSRAGRPSTSSSPGSRAAPLQASATTPVSRASRRPVARDVRGTVTRREEDERYAFVELDVTLDVSFEPRPQDVRELLARAERDCFVGASLTTAPRYSWIVDGEEIL